jgi:hypothetical protein
VLPFDRYDGKGRKLLGPPAFGDGSSRRGYGVPVFQQCGYECAYCGWGMGDTYEAWLQLSVDHVIPAYTGGKGYPREWVGDIANLATCCRACNEFLNGYRVKDPPPQTLDQFFELRDKHFEGKRAWVAKRHEHERSWYTNWYATRGTQPPAASVIDPKEALRTFLSGQYEALCRVEPACAGFPMPAINPPLQEDEAGDFMRGLEAGLFNFDDHGYYQTPMRWVKGILFGHTPISGKRILSRETITQTAAASALVLSYKWPMAQVAIESGDLALDLLVTDSSGRVVVGGEAKTTSPLLDAMLHEVQTCVLADEDCTHREHKKIRGLRKERPEFFWAVAPGDRRAFRVEYLRSRLVLEQVEDIPLGDPPLTH